MPPLIGIDRGIDGEMLKALEEIGHGAQIVVVDASYDIPEGAQTVSYHGDSSARALTGILKLVPVDENDVWTLTGKKVGKVVAMLPDPPETECAALAELREAFPLGNGPVLVGATRFGQEHEKGVTKRGFYAAANDPEKHTLFVRTRDEKAYACAMFAVGHSQV